MAGKVVLLLSAAVLLQLHLTFGSPFVEQLRAVTVNVPLSDESLLQEAKQTLQTGLEILQDTGEINLCNHLQTVLNGLNSSEKLTWVTYGSPPPDHSLLNDKLPFWSTSSSQQGGQNNHFTRIENINVEELDKIFYATVVEGKILSLSDVLFLNESTGLPHNALVNMTYDCKHQELKAHIKIRMEIEVVRDILNFSTLILSLRVNMHSPPSITTSILSGEANVFGVPTFFVVRHRANMVDLKGIPTTVASFDIQNSGLGMGLRVTPAISEISDLIFEGDEENGITNIAIRGQSNDHSIVLLHQSSMINTTTALLAEFDSIQLDTLISTALDVNISHISLYHGLIISEISFSSATDEMTSSLISRIIPPDSPMAVFGSTIPTGITAFFTVSLARTVMTGTLIHDELLLMPKTTPLTLEALLNSYSSLNAVKSFPLIETYILRSIITNITFNPQTGHFVVSLKLSEMPLIHGVMILSSVELKVAAMLGQTLSIESLIVTGTWVFGSLNVSTLITFNTTSRIYHMKAKLEEGSVLRIDSLFESVLGVSHPTALSLLTLNSVMGNIYSNGNYFIAMSGSVPTGRIHLLFIKDTNGTKVGITGSIKNFKFSDLVKIATGNDISNVAYFGNLTLPAIALSITSDVIKNKALPHIFGKESSLLIYSDTLPAGVTSRFNLNITNRKIVGMFSNGVVTLIQPKAVDFTLKDLALQISSITDEIEALPSEIISIMEAKIHSISYNSTLYKIQISLEISELILISDFLSLSNVDIIYKGTLESTLTTQSVNIYGDWHVIDHSFNTSVVYDGTSGEFSITSHLNEEVFITDIIQRFTGHTLSMPPNISKFHLTEIIGQIARGNISVVLNGEFSSGNITVVFQEFESESVGAVVVEASKFKLAEFVLFATGADITGIPFFGTLEIPKLWFAVATDDFIPRKLTPIKSTLQMFSTGFVKGVSGRALIKIRDVSGIAVNFVNNLLTFRVSNASSLPLTTVATAIAGISDTLNSVPSQFSSILSTKVNELTFNPDSNELMFKGSINSSVEIVSQLMTFNNIKVMMVLVLGSQNYIKTINLSGDWILSGIPIHVTMEYNENKEWLEITGDLKSQVDINDLIASLTESKLTIPPVLSSVTLSRLTGRIDDNNTLIILSGSVNKGHVHFIYHKSSTSSSVALAAEVHDFRLSSLVSCAVGIDISNIPFFGTLIIPHIGITLSSDYITSPLLSSLYPQSSLLSAFGDTLEAGLRAEFQLAIGEAKDILCNFVDGELQLIIPDYAEISLNKIIQLLPSLQTAIKFLPQALQNMDDFKVVRLNYKPSIDEIILSGVIDSFAVVPNVLNLHNNNFIITGTIGKNANITFVSFNGIWDIHTLSLMTKVVYDDGIFLIDAYPENEESLSQKSFMKSLNGSLFEIPSTLDIVEIKYVIGSIEDEIFSLVFIGRVRNIGNVSIIYEKTHNKVAVVFLADINQLKLSELVHVGTGIDITNVPYFGKLVIPAVSFSISSEEFSTLHIPDLNIPGIPTTLFHEIIPKGVNGRVELNIGKTVGVIGEYFENRLIVTPPISASISLSDLLSLIPEITSIIESLPSAVVKSIKNAIINKLAFDAASGGMLISLSIKNITIIPPQLLLLEEVNVSLDISMNDTKVANQEDKHAHFNYKMFHVLGEEKADLQTVSINELVMAGTWNLLGIKFYTQVKYDKNLETFIIEGAPKGSNSLDINNLIKKFSNAEFQLPQLSTLSLEGAKAVTSASHANATLIISATAGTSTNVYLLFQITSVGSTIAIAIDFQFTLVDLIQTVLKVDLNSVSFINSFEAVSMAFTVSTDFIHSHLLETVVKPDTPLKAYGNDISKGVTAYSKVLICDCLEVEVTYAEGLLDFTMPQHCKVSLRCLLSEVAIISGVIRILPPPISDILGSEIETIEFNAVTKTLSVEAVLHEFSVLDVLVLSNIHISFVATLTSNGGLKSLTFSGDWSLDQYNVRMSVLYDQTTQKLSFRAFPNPSLSISHTIQSLLNSNFDIPSFLNAGKLSTIIGQKTADDSFSFAMSGKIGTIVDVYLVYQKNVGESPNIALAASIDSFLLADIIYDVVDINIRTVPYFGSLRIPHVGLMISTGDITTPLLNSLLPANSLLKRYANTFSNGFTAFFDLSLSEGKSLRGTYANNIVSFSPYGGKISLGSVIDAISGIDIQSTGITTIFKNILQIDLKHFTFDIKSQKMAINVFINEFSILGGSFSIHNVNVLLNIKFSTPSIISAEASAIITLGKNDYKVSIKRDPSTTHYVLTLNTERLPIFAIVTEIGAAFLPNDLQTILSNIFNINILNASITYQFGAVPQQLVITGMPQLFGLETVHVTALMIAHSGGTKLIQKYTFPKFSITNLFNKLLGGSVPSKLLDVSGEIGLIVSPITLQGVSLSIPQFKHVDIREGLSIFTTVSWPSSCGSDIFCKVMKILLGGGTLNLQGKIANARYFSVTASVSDVNLGGGVILQKAGLQFVGGVEQSVGLVGSIKLKTPPVTLNAGIQLRASGVKFEGSMSGCWYKAFGMSFLTLCNLYLGMTILPVVPPVTGLEFGGRIEIGKQSCSKGKLITAEAYVGMNLIDPTQNYFYADIGSLTFQSFFDSFCMDVPLPKPLGDSGFPKGLKASFSLLGKQLPHAGITIPIGFRLKGTINILGLQATVDINISPTRFKISASLPPLNILGIFKMYKSSGDTSNGPFLNVDISATKEALIEIGGFVNVMGISVEGRLLISSTKYESFIEGRFLGLLQASLRITATYSFSKLSDANYEVEGHFKNDLFDKIAQAIRDGLKKSAEVASKYLSAAQDKIREAQAKFDDAISILESAKRKVDDANRVFDEAISKMEDARRKIDGICQIKSCGSVCVGCPRGWHCCGKVWGKCVCTYPGWDSCCTRVTDPVCTIANAACWLLKKPLDLILQVAIVVVDKSRHTLDIVKVALSVAQGILNGVKVVLDGAIAALEGVKVAYKVGVSAISALVNFALTQIINIQEIYFRAALSEANGGEFMCRVQGVLMGMKLDMVASFNARNIWSLVCKIAEKAVQGLCSSIG